MKNKIQLLLLLTVVVIMAACGNQKKTKDGFTILKNGLEIKFLEDKEGPKADSGSLSKCHIVVRVDDSVVFDTKKVNNNQPVPQPIQPTRTIGDWMAGFYEMSKGDKAIFRAPADSIFQNPAQRPPFVKAGSVIEYEVEMVDLQTPADIEKEKKERLAEQSKQLDAYIKEKNINATKTASGMYIAITKEGTGAKAMPGQTAVMNYTGTLLDGTKFDSNVDPKFKHVEPFSFPLGQGRVIPGWDEGVALLNKGAKATFIIPSDLAYGERANPGNDVNPKGIPAHSPLVFDVELVDIKEAEMQQQPQISADGSPQ